MNIGFAGKTAIVTGGAHFHARLEITRATVQVFIDGAAQPTLVVQRLRGDPGGIGLWVDSQPASFADLQSHPAG